MKILDSIWFNEIGIVRVDDGFVEKCYIGRGRGISQEEDEKFIANFGVPFDPEMIKNWTEREYA